MSLTLKPQNEHPDPIEPQRKKMHPLLVLSFAVGLGVAAGYLDSWDTAVNVLMAVMALFSPANRGPATPSRSSNGVN
ncbi:hypothetical protein [Nocardia carnea]|uniref:hypothetical protein n=1 Tax=Nocardia carnea TaxID=37328 RepID=UPI0024570608|nr:hypothetical protein [Nocardia carnea]